MATTRRRAANDAPRQRINARIDAESHKRLHVHALMLGLEPGRLLDQLIANGCKSWRIQQVGPGPVVSKDRPEVGENTTQTLAISA